MEHQSCPRTESTDENRLYHSGRFSGDFSVSIPAGRLGCGLRRVGDGISSVNEADRSAVESSIGSARGFLNEMYGIVMARLAVVSSDSDASKVKRGVRNRVPTFLGTQF